MKVSIKTVLGNPTNGAGALLGRLLAAATNGAGVAVPKPWGGDPLCGLPGAAWIHRPIISTDKTTIPATLIPFIFGAPSRPVARSARRRIAPAGSRPLRESDKNVAPKVLGASAPLALAMEVTVLKFPFRGPRSSIPGVALVPETIGRVRSELGHLHPAMVGADRGP
ncbi:MAG: hypothetical protein ACRECR_00515, partial [Thermoplasmata archaeon]